MITPDTSSSNEDNVLKFAIEANAYYLANNLHMAYLQLNVAMTFATLVGDSVYGILNTASKKIETELLTKKLYLLNPVRGQTSRVGC